VQSNDSSIGDILQQLQQKLGPQFSKPGGAAQPQPATAFSSSSSSSKDSSADALRAMPAAGSTADAGAAVAKFSRRRGRPRLLLKEQQQKEQQQRIRSKQHQRALLKEQKVVAFQQLQASADVLLQQRPPSASASSSRATEQSSSSSKPKSQSSTRTTAGGSTAVSSSSSSSGKSKKVKSLAQPRTRRRIGESIADSTGEVGWSADLGPLPPGVAAVVASTAAPVEVQRQLLRSLVAGQGVPSSRHVLARRLMHFDQACQLLGGPERAASILERDSSLLLMAPAVLQRKLKQLQELLALASPGAAADGSSSASSTPEAAELADAAAAGSRRQAVGSSSSSSSSGDGAYRVSGEVLGLLRSHPGLLRLSAAGLEQRLASLQASLGLASKQEALQVRLQAPIPKHLNLPAQYGECLWAWCEGVCRGRGMLVCKEHACCLECCSRDVTALHGPHANKCCSVLPPSESRVCWRLNYAASLLICSCR
jgi:hypothetical protein